MLSEKFLDVLKNEGVVSIVTCVNNEPHVVNTWNSFMVVTEDERILIPAYAMKKTEKNILENNKITVALGSKEVSGYNDYPGTGFIVEATGKFVDTGKEYNMMKDKFSFLTRVLELKIVSSKQML